MVATPRGSHKSQEALAYLRQHIAAGRWEVGERIPKETELMDLMGVGKSTVREAVRSLANLGMLETIPGVGTFLRSRTPVSTVLSQFLADHDLGEVLIYRRSLEIEAAQMAALNRTDKHLEALRSSYERGLSGTEAHPSETTPGSFHHLIVEACGSSLLYDLYRGVMTVITNAISRGFIVREQDRALMSRDHAAILEAIEQGNVRDAAHSMALHADRDLWLTPDEHGETPQATERVSTLIDAGYDS